MKNGVIAAAAAAAAAAAVCDITAILQPIIFCDG